MKAVQQFVADKQAEFARHPFFQSLAAGVPLEHALRYAPRLTFWVMAFQDVLRLNEQLVRAPELRRIVLKHRAEDSGHDAWFLHDLRAITGNVANLPARDLFSREHATVRDATYRLMAETMQANDERLRVVLLLTLEAVGHVFFERVSHYVESIGRSGELKYFSMHHYDVECDHQLFSEGDELDNIVLPRRVRLEAQAMIGRAFAAFDTMFDGLMGDEAAPATALRARGQARVLR